MYYKEGQRQIYCYLPCAVFLDFVLARNVAAEWCLYYLRVEKTFEIRLLKKTEEKNNKSIEVMRGDGRKEEKKEKKRKGRKEEDRRGKKRTGEQSRERHLARVNRK